DVHDLAPLLNVAFAPVALQQFAGLGMAARRVARLDAEDATVERLLANQLLERAAQHEANAFLARRELERAGERDAVAEGVRPDDAARVVHLHRRERARALRVRPARILGRDRAGPHVVLVAENEETDA